MTTQELRVFTWNVLAAPWAGPRHYPDAMDPELLDRQVRTRRLVDVLRSAAPSVDVVFLQEVTFADIDTFHGALGPDTFIWFGTSNEPHYWSNWLDDPADWEPNGVVVFLRRDRFTVIEAAETAVGPFGNRSVVVTAHRAGADPVVVVPVHLDADDAERRFTEWESVLDLVRDLDGPVLIAGDFNTDTTEPQFAAANAAAGIVDLVEAAGNADPTHPYVRVSDSYARLGRIDHVVGRGVVATSAAVSDLGSWELERPADRIALVLERTGTDHLAVRCTVVA